jgi:hypothetical protein
MHPTLGQYFCKYLSIAHSSGLAALLEIAPHPDRHFYWLAWRLAGQSDQREAETAPAMNAVRWTFCALLLIPAIVIIAGNWWIVMQGVLLRRKQVPSWIPIVGGVLACAACLLAPPPAVRRLWWVGFVADWGSLPGMTSTAVWFLKEAYRRRSR